MRVKRKQVQFSEEDLKLMEDTTLSPDVLSVLISKPKSKIREYRHRIKYKEQLKEAQARFRAKQRKKNIEKFGKVNGCYDYWKESDVEYLLASKEPDDVIAEKLHRTVEAIRKKRARELAKRNRR